MQGKTKPHVFSWVIWGLVTFIVFLAQLSDDGGLGAWPIGVSGVFSVYVAYLAYIHKSDITLTKIDWAFFAIALGSIPLWYFTSDALYSVIILTVIDVCGFAPTFRKSYNKPFDEPLIFFLVMTARNFISMIALENYSIITTIFPAVTGVTGLVFILMVVYRRKDYEIS